MSMLELTVAIALIALGVLGFSRTIVASGDAAEAARERGRAHEAARAVLEELRGEPFDLVFSKYDGVQDGQAQVSESGFSVPGLSPLPLDFDGLPGEILFPVEPLAPAVLREDTVLPSLGMPCDLDGDGVVDELDHAGDYTILPVMVRIRWQGSSGPSRLELRTILAAIQ